MPEFRKSKKKSSGADGVSSQGFSSVKESTPSPARPMNKYARNAANYHAVAKRMNRGRKIAIGIVASFLGVLLCTGTAFAMYLGYINDLLNRGNKSDKELMDINDALRTKYNSSLNEPFYMLLIGSDSRFADSSMGSRSDTNIVCRIDPIEDVITMISIPRDTKVDLGYNGVQKFNAAYAFNGAAGAILAAEDLLDVDIAHYAEVNFQELAGLVDAVGGVTVDVSARIDDYHCDDGDGSHYVIEPGVQTLNGGEALTFARSRYAFATGDFARQSNQRQLIEALIKKVLATPINQIPGVIEKASKSVTTDLSVMDIIGLAQQFADNKDITIYSAMVPSYTQMINGISFVINDAQKTVEMMKVVNEGKDPSTIVSPISTAPAINDSSVDTSQTLIFADDDNSAPDTGAPVDPNQPGSNTGTETPGGTTDPGNTGGEGPDTGGNTGTGGTGEVTSPGTGTGTGTSTGTG